MKTMAAFLLAMSCTTLALPVIAQEAATGSAGGRPFPQMHSANGVKFMCGGIGIREAAYMRQIASDYDLMLTFAASNGAYLADIDIEISRDKGEKLVTSRCNGPIMLVDVAQQGNYRITAKTEGHEVAKNVKIRDGQAGRQLAVTWPARLLDEPSAALR